MTGAIFGYPLLIIKYLVYGIKLKRLCTKNGYSLCKNGIFWWLGNNKSGKHNFTVKSQDKSYCVKLIGVRSKKILFGFVDENTYEIKDYTFAILWTMDGFEYDLKKKEAYIFEENSIPCIVMVSESNKVTVKDKTARTEIASGDQTKEVYFYFGKDFLKMIKEH